MDTKRIIIISGLVFLGLGIAGFVGYKIYRTARTKSGDPQKDNRVVKLTRSK